MKRPKKNKSANGSHQAGDYIYALIVKVWICSDLENSMWVFGIPNCPECGGIHLMDVAPMERDVRDFLGAADLIFTCTGARRHIWLENEFVDEDMAHVKDVHKLYWNVYRN